MALPELLLPVALPPFVNDGHNVELTPAFVPVPTQTGHSRRRRVFTTVPRVVDVTLILDRAEAAAFDAWFEGPLEVGVQPFSARVKNLGPGMLWWHAKFVAPYTATEINRQYSRITARLLLSGAGQVDTPYTPAMQASVHLALHGSATLTTATQLSAAVTVALLPATYLSAAVSVALITARDGAGPSSDQVDKRWVWMQLNYARGRSADVADTAEIDQRSWMGF